MSDINCIMLSNAVGVLRETGAAAVILYIDAIDDWDVWKCLNERDRLVIVTQSGQVEDALNPHRGELKAVVRLPSFRLTRIGQIKLSVITCVTAGIIGNSDKVVCLGGASGSGVLDVMLVLDLSTETEVITARGVTQGLLKITKPEVLETVLNLALELAGEGREGKALGTMFVIGDYAKVSELARQLIMNPFKGYPEQARNILDVAVHESIKEFALIDGAFLVREDGVVMSAGAHLDAALRNEEGHLPGLGSRHMAAAGISDVTDAVAVTISGSTGVVRIFKGGRIVLEMERPGQSLSGRK